MMKIPAEIGRVVISKCGRDEGRKFLVVKEEGDDFVYIADGKTHKIAKPKKKRRSHLIATNTLNEEMRESIARNAMPEDYQIRACLCKEEG